MNHTDTDDESNKTAPMMVECPDCGSHLEADEIARDRGTVWCDECSREVGLHDAAATHSPTPGAGAEGANAASPEAGRSGGTGPKVRLPPRVEHRPQADGLYLVRHWNRKYGLVYVVICGLMLFNLVRGDAVLLEASFFGFVAIGGFFAILYLMLAQLLNETHIHVKTVASGDPKLRIRHGPLPWPGGTTVPADQIRQLFVSKEERWSRYGRYVSYALEAKITGGREETLLDELKSPDDAEAIERAVENHLGIEDRPVPSAYGNSATGWLW